MQELRAGIKDALASVRVQYFYDRPEALEETFYASGVVVRALTRLVERFMEKLTEKKREKNVLDFSDLEHLALEILVVHDETGCKCRCTIEENRLTDWKCKMLSGLTAFSVFIIEGAQGKSKIKTRRKILRIV